MLHNSDSVTYSAESSEHSLCPLSSEFLVSSISQNECKHLIVLAWVLWILKHCPTLLKHKVNQITSMVIWLLNIRKEYVFKRNFFYLKLALASSKGNRQRSDWEYWCCHRGFWSMKWSLNWWWAGGD